MPRARQIKTFPEWPWDQLPRETGPAFRAFRHYRDSLPEKRSQRATSAAIGTDRALLIRWSSKHSWIDRVRAYDRYLDHQRLHEEAAAAREAGRRHGQMLNAAQSALFMPIRALLKDRRLPDGTKIPRASELERMPTERLLIEVDKASRALALVIGAERVIRGEPSSIEKQISEGTIQPAVLPENPIAAEGEGDALIRAAMLMDAMVEAGIGHDPPSDEGEIIDEAPPSTNGKP